MLGLSQTRLYPLHGLFVCLAEWSGFLAPNSTTHWIWTRSCDRKELAGRPDRPRPRRRKRPAPRGARGEP